MYEVANTALTYQHIYAISLLAHRREYIHNIYELPSLEPTIRYLVWCTHGWAKILHR